MRITRSNVENYKKTIKSLDDYKLTHADGRFGNLIALCKVDKETGATWLKTDFVPYKTMWYMLKMHEMTKNNEI